jgi:transposase
VGNVIIFLIIYRLEMALTLDERVEIVLLSGRQGWTQRQVADEFNDRHPQRNPITHSAVGKLVKKFKETGSVVDKPRVGRPSLGEEVRIGVIAKFHASPQKSIRQTSAENGVPKSTLHDILKKEKLHSCSHKN